MSKDSDKVLSGTIANDDKAEWISPVNIYGEEIAENLSGTIMELGTGDGEMAYKIADQNPGSKVVAVDIAPAAVKNGYETYKKSGNALNLEYIIGDGLRSFKPESFDYICSFNSIQEIKQPEQLFQDIKEMLKPGGEAIITVPGADSEEVAPSHAKVEDEQTGLTMLRYPFEIDGEKGWNEQYFFPKKWMEETLSDIGLEIIHHGKIECDPRGMPDLSEFIEDDYAPKVPYELLDYIEENGLDNALENRKNKFPTVDKYRIKRSV